MPTVYEIAVSLFALTVALNSIGISILKGIFL